MCLIEKIIKEQGQKAVQGAGKDAPLVPAVTAVASVATKPITQVPVGSVLKTAKVAMPVPVTVRGKLEAALAEMLECRRIIANLNPT